MIFLPVSFVNGLSWLPLEKFSASSLNEGGMDGQTKAGLSVGTSGGGTSPVSTCKTVLMEGL